MSSLLPREFVHIQAALAIRGYQSDAAFSGSMAGLEAGTTIALQFGDRVEAGSHGVPRVTIHGTIQINGDDGPSAGAVRLTLRKSGPGTTSRAIELALDVNLQIAIEQDCGLPEDLRLGVSAIQSAQAYHHLQGLITDAAGVARETVVAPRRTGVSGPAMCVRARLLGDLAIGRAGLAQSSDRKVSQECQRAWLAACDWLQQRILPELRLIIRDLSPKAGHRAGLIHPAIAPCKRELLPFLEPTRANSEHETVQ